MQQKEKTIKLLLICVLAGIFLVGVLVATLLMILIQPETPLQENSPQQQTQPPTTELPRYNAYANTYFLTDEKGYIHCPEENGVMGIDVSSFQGDIDWEAVKNAGVEFVFIRVGYRGNTEGGLYADDRAQSYYKGAKKAGLKVGAYFFSQAVNTWEAQQEAWFVLRQVKNWELDLPVVYDWEWVSDEARTANLSGTMLTCCTKAFCGVIENAGVPCMVYFNTNQALNMLDMESLQKYPLWLAQYSDAPDFPYRVDYWQYSCTGTVPGIETEVDLNLWFP